MPRTARASVGGVCYHVLNRGNARMRVFHGDEDYEAFVDLLDRACERLPMRVLTYCLMPNHFHLVLLPHGDGDLGRWMQWLLTSHVRRHHRRRRSSGHVWQGRFKAFPIQQDAHLVMVLRYVQRGSGTRGTGRAGRGVAVVEPSVVEIARAAGLSVGVAHRATARVAPAGQHAPGRARPGSGSPFGDARQASR